MTSWDYVIVGGGTAGSVLASRLTEDPSARVLLVEAGQDVVPGQEPRDIASLFPQATFNNRYTWPGLHVHWRRPGDGPASPFQQGRILGGGGTVMGMWALRGVPDDYDGWERDGAVGWGWRDVLPFFRKLETDHDFQGPDHGTNGPVPIRRQPERDWSALAAAVHAVSARSGQADIADMNADFGDGHCTLPLSRFERSRASAAICYLTAEVRRRPNLKVLTDATVTRLTVSGRSVTGIELRRADGSLERVAASETIMAAGALQTPVLLMRAGIGPGAHLAQCGIPVLHHLAGVGRNLQNHPLLPALAVMPGRYAERGLDRPTAGTFLRWTMQTRGDMGMYVRSYLVWHALGRRLAMLAPVLLAPLSRGWVELSGPAPENAPVTAFNFFDRPADLHRMVDGFRRAAALFAAPKLRRLCGEAFAVVDAARLSRYNSLSRRNAALGWLGAKAFDLSPRLGTRLLATLAQQVPLADLLRDAAGLEGFVRANTVGTNHPTGTCRMGRADDPHSVVSVDGAVHGIGGLRVADASVMPSVPSGNTHIPTVMVAEKIATSILQARRSATVPGVASLKEVYQ